MTTKHTPTPITAHTAESGTSIFIRGPMGELLAELMAHDDNAAGIREMHERATAFVRAVNAHAALRAELAAALDALASIEVCHASDSETGKFAKAAINRGNRYLATLDRGAQS